MPKSAYVTENLKADMIAWRHDFHAHPELGFDEYRTSERVAELLESFGFTSHREIGKTGVVGIFQKGTSQNSIAIRADMDALPISELNDFSYKSTNQNVMHACGHDGHTSMLLGAAKYLGQYGKFDGKLVLIFQPNEEHGLGAAAMIDDGLFERFDADQVFGMHNIPGMEIGTFATRSGPITASESLFEISINAKGGHAALPHMGVDAIMVGSQIVNAMQTIVSRKLNPGLNGVVSITEFITDGKRNVLPGKAILRGDARALTNQINEKIEARMRQITAGICEAHGVEATVSYETIFPPIINSKIPAIAASRAARDLFGEEAVDDNCPAKLFSEDFAHLAEARPGCFILMGNGTNGSHARPLHSADYDFCDEGLVPGSSYWVNLVEQQLKTAN